MQEDCALIFSGVGQSKGLSFMLHIKKHYMQVK